MKQILPILTLTTLTAAAFADAPAPAAAAQSFNYNTVSVAYISDDFKNATDNLQLTALTLSNKIAKNIVGTVGLLNGSESGADHSDLQGFSVGLGYIYSVNSNLDVVASWSHTLLQTSVTDSQNINIANYEVGVRYNVGSRLELNASVGRNNYQHEESNVTGANKGTFRSSYSVGAAYKLDADFTVSAKAIWNNGSTNGDSKGYSVGVSYNY